MNFYVYYREYEGVIVWPFCGNMNINGEIKKHQEVYGIDVQGKA